MSLDSWIFNPFAVVEEKFERRNENGNWIEKVHNYFQSELANDEIYKKIPYMSTFLLPNIKDQQVVKFRGMVQDILNPEYYLESYEVLDGNADRTLKPGAYKDELTTPPNFTVDFDSPNATTGERKVYCLIPIPGENRWVKELLDTSFACEASMHDLSLKRKVGDLDDVDELSLNKQRRNENGSVGTERGANSKCTSKHNVFPFVDSNNISCLAKLYNNLELKLNDIVEVTGIVYLPSGSCPSAEVQLLGTEADSENSRGSEIRIHCFHTRKLEHYNPLIDNVKYLESIDVEWMRESRELLCSVLEEALLGDCLAAEYLILHLVSSVYMRQDMLALGSFSLNLTGINQELQKQEFPRRLFTLLQSITTHSSYLPMTIDNINNLPFIPQKDYQADRLCSGVLQLPANSHLVLDETKLSAGQLNESGVKNITALGNLINWQKVDTDFKYYTLEQPSNVAVLIFSEGKSISESNCRLKFNPSHCDVRTGYKRLQSLLTEENLKNIRTYLTLARLHPYKLTDDMKMVVENHFVSSRQSSNILSVDGLHKLLIMGRLVSISCGQSQMTPDTWKSAQILTSERENRENN